MCAICTTHTSLAMGAIVIDNCSSCSCFLWLYVAVVGLHFQLESVLIERFIYTYKYLLLVE